MSSEESLAGKVCFIAGASRGVGRACALALARNGVRCFLIARSVSGLETVASEVEEAYTGGGRDFADDRKNRIAQAAAFVAADVMEDAQLRNAVVSCVNTFGRLDFLICNAGVNRRKQLENADIEIWDQVVHTNMISAMHLTRLCLPHLAENPGSAVIYMSSFAIRNPTESLYDGIEPYVASKAGIHAFAQTSFHALSKRGVKVSCINFGLTATDLGTRKPASGPLANSTPVAERMLQPDDIAHAVLYICRSSPTACPLDIDLIPMTPYEQILSKL